MESRTDIIEGKKIDLRRMTVDDTANILKWRNSPFVTSHFIYRLPLTKEGHLKWIREKVDKGSTEQFIIELKDKTGIGSVYLQHIDNDRKSAEFGIFIGDESRSGKGYGDEALKLILSYAKAELGLHMIELKVLSDNEGALKLYEKNGFEKTDDLVMPSVPEGIPLDVIKMEKVL